MKAPRSELIDLFIVLFVSTCILFAFRFAGVYRCPLLSPGMSSCPPLQQSLAPYALFYLLFYLFIILPFCNLALIIVLVSYLFKYLMRKR